MNIAESLAFAAASLEASGVAESRREAASLLTFVLARPGSFLIAHPEYELNDSELTGFEECVRRRSNREPFQYITGTQEFFGLEFRVTRDVLIPRPETEVLVEAAIEVLGSLKSPHFLEIGVGSGCISISILHSVIDAQAVAVDVSSGALRIAMENAHIHGVSERLRLRERDLFDGLNEKFDMIVSNPPYIPDLDIGQLQPEVRTFEPHSALAGGSDGLDIIKRIVDGAPGHLKPGGSLLLEIGFGEADAVELLFRTPYWLECRLLPDLQGIPRIIIAKLAV